MLFEHLKRRQVELTGRVSAITAAQTYNRICALKPIRKSGKLNIRAAPQPPPDSLNRFLLCEDETAHQ